MPGHLPDDRLGERAVDGRRPNQHGRLDLRDDLRQADTGGAVVRPAGDLSGGPGIGDLEVTQIRHVVGEQALPVHAPDLPRGGVAVRTVTHHRVAELVGDPHPSGAGPEDHHRCSRMGVPATRVAPSAAPSTIAPVPCTSSLKVQTWSR
jgi:hypothetical protein